MKGLANVACNVSSVFLASYSWVDATKRDRAVTSEIDQLSGAGTMKRTFRYIFNVFREIYIPSNLLIKDSNK